MNESIKHLQAFVKGVNKVNADMVKLNEKRQGTYTHAVLAAIVAGDRATFEKSITSFMDDIRSNKGGLARKLGCSIAKRQPKGQPANKPTYTVPSAVSSVKSYLLSAFEYELDTGSVEEPRPFTQIRDEVRTIKADENRAKLSGDDAVRADIAEALASIGENLETCKGKALKELAAHVDSALKVSRDERAAHAKKATPAKAKAKAPKKAAAKKAA